MARAPPEQRRWCAPAAVVLSPLCGGGDDTPVRSPAGVDVDADIISGSPVVDAHGVVVVKHTNGRSLLDSVVDDHVGGGSGRAVAVAVPVVASESKVEAVAVSAVAAVDDDDEYADMASFEEDNLVVTDAVRHCACVLRAVCLTRL